MASNTMTMSVDNSVFNDDENDSIVPVGHCKWNATTGFRPPSDCFAPYIIRTARRASFPPSESIKKFDISGFEHRRPASRNLLKQIQEMYSNISQDEKNKIFEEKSNPAKRVKSNNFEMNEQMNEQINSQIEPKIKSLAIENNN
jgi:hypothetical protein